MKKTLIAVAALAATGAFAQNVTVYGRLDVGYASTTNTVTAAGVSTDTKATGVQSHNSVSSMWGLKGSEDLGGGMNAFFILEQDVYPADGNQGVSGAGGGLTSAAVFDRVSLLGVNGGFGSIAFGRDYTAAFKVVAATDVNALSRISTVQNAANLGGSSQPNLVFYSTPNLGGFMINLNYGNQDTGTSAAGGDAKVKTGIVSGTYANGPLYVGLAAGSVETTAGAAVSKTEGSVIGASYDFGRFKLLGNYLTSKATAAAGTAVDAKELNIGAAIPVGKVTITLQYGTNAASGNGAIATGIGAGNTDVTGTDYVIGADYNLSARTALFLKTGTYAKISGTVNGDTTVDNKNVSTAFGIKTTF